MPADSAIRVEGLRDLQRAFSLADRRLKTELRDRLRDAAEPVRADAENLAGERVRNIGGRWSRMRVGVTQRVVYVAPRERGVTSRGRASSRRPNLGGLLMDRAMQPALDQNREEVVREVDDLLLNIGREWERV